MSSRVRRPRSGSSDVSPSSSEEQQRKRQKDSCGSSTPLTIHPLIGPVTVPEYVSTPTRITSRGQLELTPDRPVSILRRQRQQSPNTREESSTSSSSSTMPQGITTSRLTSPPSSTSSVPPVTRGTISPLLVSESSSSARPPTVSNNMTEVNPLAAKDAIKKVLASLPPKVQLAIQLGEPDRIKDELRLIPQALLVDLLSNLVLSVSLPTIGTIVDAIANSIAVLAQEARDALIRINTPNLSIVKVFAEEKQSVKSATDVDSPYLKRQRTRGRRRGGSSRCTNLVNEDLHSDQTTILDQLNEQFPEQRSSKTSAKQPLSGAKQASSGSTDKRSPDQQQGHSLATLMTTSYIAQIEERPTQIDERPTDEQSNSTSDDMDTTPEYQAILAAEVEKKRAATTAIVEQNINERLEIYLNRTPPIPITDFRRRTCVANIDELITIFFDENGFPKQRLSNLSIAKRKELYLMCCSQDWTAPVRLGTNEKGRAIFAAADINQDDFICEYRGKYLSNPAQIREAEQTHDPVFGSYMYYFRCPQDGRSICIDATEETAEWGFARLINHSRRRCNTGVMAVYDSLYNRPRLIFYAKRNIKQDEELLIDYGESNPKILSQMPWLKD